MVSYDHLFNDTHVVQRRKEREFEEESQRRLLFLDEYRKKI